MSAGRKPFWRDEKGSQKYFLDFQRYRLSKRVINDLITRSTKGLVFYVIIAVAVCLYDEYYTRHSRFSVVFLIGIASVCTIRGVHVALMPWLNQRWETVSNHFFLFTVILTALVWGAGFAWFMAQDGEHPAKLLMAICSTGLCAGGIVAFIPGRSLSVMFNVLMLLPCASCLWIMSGDRMLPLMIIMFSLYMMLVSFRGNSEYWDALENEFMLSKKSAELEEISRVDVLTGLFNRRHFDEIFGYLWKSSIREKQPLTVIIVDIDHFKQINDTFGHLAGDAFLKGVAALLRSIFKRDTDVVARFGGEEFITLLPNTEEQSAVKQAEEFRAALEAFTLPHLNEVLRATVSIGIASGDGMRPTGELMQLADSRLYLAKSGGRDRVVAEEPLASRHAG